MSDDQKSKDVSVDPELNDLLDSEWMKKCLDTLENVINVIAIKMFGVVRS